VTRRIYERDYQEAEETATDLHEFKPAFHCEQVVGGGQPSSDDLVLNNVLKVYRAAGCPEDSIEVFQATRLQGKKLRELPEYLSSKTGSPWDARRVEAARGRLRRREHKLHAVALASSRWKRPQTRTAVYRERLPDGASWNGLWTYAHSYHGEELELLYEIMSRERSRLFRRK
jgi:hypothetical protein